MKLGCPNLILAVEQTPSIVCLLLSDTSNQHVRIAIDLDIIESPNSGELGLLFMHASSEKPAGRRKKA